MGGVNDTSVKRVKYLMASSVQNGPKTMFFMDYSLLVVFNAYLRSKCTIPDVYTCNCAGLVVIRSLRTALGLLKEERRKKKKEEEDEQFAWAAIFVYHFINVYSLRQRYFQAQNNRLINPRCLESRETLQQRRSSTASLRVAILIFVDKQAVPATFIDFLQALALQIPLEIVKMQ